MAVSAFAAPILPGKTDAWKQWRDQINGPRRSEWEAHQRRMGNTRHFGFLQQTPMGDMVIVVSEGDDPSQFLPRLAASNDPFDVWFKQQTLEIHGMDVSQPQPGPPPGPPPELGVSYDP